MVRVMGPGLFGLAVFSLWIYSIFDVIATESMLVRNLPKNTWLIIVLLFPGVGGIAWLALGRPLNAGWRPGDTAVRSRRGVVGFEDSDDWSSRSRTVTPPPKPRRPPTDAKAPAEPDDRESPAARERRLMEWEAELRRREDDLGKDDQA